MCTKPCGHATSIFVRGTYRPTAKWACQRRPSACNSPVHRYGRASTPSWPRNLRKNLPTCSRRTLGSQQNGGPYVSVANLLSRLAAQYLRTRVRARRAATLLDPSGSPPEPLLRLAFAEWKTATPSAASGKRLTPQYPCETPTSFVP